MQRRRENTTYMVSRNISKCGCGPKNQPSPICNNIGRKEAKICPDVLDDRIGKGKGKGI